jgi:hypothetical protein
MRIFFYPTASRPALGPTQPPIHWVPGALSLRVKRQEVKLTTHLHPGPSSRMLGAIPPLPQYAFMAWCSVKKHKENFTFTFTFTYINGLVVYIHHSDPFLVHLSIAPPPPPRGASEMKVMTYSMFMRWTGCFVSDKLMVLLSHDLLSSTIQWTVAFIKVIVLCSW